MRHYMLDIDENITYTVYIDSTKGCIIFHSQTKKKYFPKCRLVKLFFNNEAKEILIQPCYKQDAGCSALSHSVIHALRKFRNHGFKVLTGNYKAEWDLATNCLVIRTANYLGKDKKEYKPLTVRMDLNRWYILLHIPTIKAHFFNFEYVKFSFDRKSQKFAIKPVYEKTPDCVSLEYPSGRIQFYNFVTQNMISLENFRSGNYQAVWDDEMQHLVIEPGNFLGEVKRGR